MQKPIVPAELFRAVRIIYPTFIRKRMAMRKDDNCSILFIQTKMKRQKYLPITIN